MAKLVTGVSTATALTMTTLIAAPTLAQEGPGLRGTLSISSGVEISDNPDLSVSSDETTITSRTNLGFALTSETRTEQLSFGVDARLESVLSGEEDDDSSLVTSRGARLNYRRDGANSGLSFAASYSEADLDDESFGFFVDGEFDPDALVIDGGSRRRTSLRTSLNFGREGPFGVSLSARTSNVDYVDVTDPDLVDRDTTSLDGRARFRINPALTAFATAGTRVETEDTTIETERRVSYVGAGLEGEIRSGLTYSGSLTFDESETSLGDTVIEDEDGVGVSLRVTQAQPDGALSFGASSRIDEAGRITLASVQRAFDMPLGNLSVSLGVADRDDDDLQFTTGLSYLRATPRGQISAQLVQEPGTDDGDATLNTSFTLAYEEDLSPVSGWDASLSYSALSPFGSGSDDSRTSASIAYSRELTSDWGLRTGLRHSRREENGGETRTSNTIFLNIERDITFGF